MRLAPEPLTPAAFAPFGRVLDGAGSTPLTVNQGRGVRRDLAAFVAQAASFKLARYDMAASELPVEVSVLERHPLSEQVFFALDGGTALVMVTSAQDDGQPDLAAARAFIVGPDVPILYSAGTWHAPLFALGRRSAFLMGMHESGTAADCETIDLSTALIVEQGSRDAGIG